jgi:hypothetical protein
MMCQYSTRGLVSRGKRDRALDSGAADGSGDALDIATGTVMAVRSRALPKSLTAITHRANSATVLSSGACGRWSVENTLLDHLASDLYEVTQAYRLSSRFGTPG